MPQSHHLEDLFLQGHEPSPKHTQRLIEKGVHIAQESYLGEEPIYDMMRYRLESAGVLKEIISITKKEYGERILPEEDAEQRTVFPLASDWEMLTILRLYDKETADHSLGVYHLAREKIDQILPGGIILSDAFQQPQIGITRAEFLRACLLHDIGKLGTPLDVLTNHMDDTTCAQLLLDHHEIAKNLFAEHNLPDLFAELASPPTAAALLRKIYERGTRPQAIIPLQMLITDRFRRWKVDEQLKKQGLSVDNTLLEAMKVHEDISRNILASKGFSNEAKLAGSHHEHHKDDLYAAELGNPPVMVNLADVIHYVDVAQAMSSKRHYKGAKPPLTVLSALANEAERKDVSKSTFALLMESDLHTLQASEDYQKPTSDSPEGHDLAHVESFLRMQKFL